jgi:RNA 3'-terminal phosphate cyclase
MVDAGEELNEADVGAEIVVTLGRRGPAGNGGAELFVESCGERLRAGCVENDRGALERIPVAIAKRAHVFRLPRHN